MNACKFNIIQDPIFELQTIKQPQKQSAVKNPDRLSIKCKNINIRYTFFSLASLYPF